MALGHPDMKILVVDDFQTMRRIVKTLLRQIGYSNFVEAEDGAQALAALKETPDIDLVVSDWSMPTMNGIDLLKAIRADGQLSHLPFLMLATEEEKENMPEAMAFGVSSYVVKPFTGQTLAEKLARIYTQQTIKQAS